ncbi:hypothetical protein Psch_03555 [Pelotomaculum schinkii]|uniref:Uncharacterized protein n=1 Tax=Pelotomaculum schinkii TaxID=78350 RepID=A0A4Y7R7X5_9FIRM|nr:hypothetical protein [Pelotomaculum schinkii]TEB04793.1 hypothetical protein Psch_03555 [Pelotomaculum schinkii]
MERLKQSRKGYTSNREGKELKPEVRVVFGDNSTRLQDAFRLLAEFFEQEKAEQDSKAGGGNR